MPPCDDEADPLAGDPQADAPAAAPASAPAGGGERIPSSPARSAFAPTWHARSGRLGTTKQRALVDVLPSLLPDPPPERWRPDRPRTAIELGAGTGEAATELARRRPDLFVVAAEVHRSSLATLVLRAAEGPPNLRVWPDDGRIALAAAPAGTVELVRVFFPDPWPKRRHHGRRLVDEAFVALVADRLRPGGHVELATDDPAYAAVMRRLLDAHPDLAGGPAPRAERPVTHYERLASHDGRPVVDLRYVRIDHEPAGNGHSG